MFLFDAHSHLPTPEAALPDHPRVVCGTQEGDWEAVLAHAASHPAVLPMLGLHPWFVEEAAPEWPARLDALLSRSRAGVGECGLDYSRAATDREAQLAALRAQLRLARRHRRPVALHVVKAWGPLMHLLREEGVPEAGAMVHAFSGSLEIAMDLQAMGVFLSFSDAGLSPGRVTAITAVRGVPSSHLLVESEGTGSLEGSLARMAELRGVAVDQLAARTWKNGQRCFREVLP